LILAASVVGLLLADRIVITPLSNLWKERAAKIGLRRAEVRKGEALMQRESFLVRRWKEMNASSLPLDPSQAEDTVLSQLDAWSRSSGLAIASYTPQWRSDATDHSRIDVRVDGVTSMGGLVDFLHRVDRKELPLRIDLLALTARDKTGSQLGFEMRLSGLLLTGEKQ